MNYWLVKSEPDAYSWEQLQKDGRTFWNGVRNYQARNNLKAMKIGDKVLYYHSNVGKDIVGIAEVAKEFYQDPTTDDERWVVVDIVPKETLKRSISLEDIKTDKVLKNMALLKQGRLSVVPVTADEYKRILELAK